MSTPDQPGGPPQFVKRGGQPVHSRHGEQKPPVSGWAVASFLVGLNGIFFVAPILGIIALGRIRERGERGRGFAIAGLALSAVWLVVIAVVIAVVIFDDADRDDEGRIVTGGRVSVFDVAVGDCLKQFEEASETMSVEGTPCSAPHRAEAIGRFTLPDREWPGLDRVAAAADTRCTQALSEFGSSVAEDPDVEVFYLHPTERSWDLKDDREVICIARTTDARRGALRERAGG